MAFLREDFTQGCIPGIEGGTFMQNLHSRQARPRRSFCGMVLVMAALMLFATAAWGQFTTQVTGNAAACTSDGYNKTGNVTNGYNIEGKAKAPACDKAGEANSSSSANVGPPKIKANITTTLAPKTADVAQASALATDTAILTPPDSYTGSATEVKVRGQLGFELKGVAGKATGGYEFQVLATGINAVVVAHGKAKTNGGANHEFEAPVSVADVDGQWLVQVSVGGELSGTASTGSAVTGNLTIKEIKLVLLTADWSCKWASNGSNCGS